MINFQGQSTTGSEVTLIDYFEEMELQPQRDFFGPVNWRARGWERLSWVTRITEVSDSRLRRAIKQGKLKTRKLGVTQVNMFDVIELFQIPRPDAPETTMEDYSIAWCIPQPNGDVTNNFNASIKKSSAHVVHVRNNGTETIFLGSGDSENANLLQFQEALGRWADERGMDVDEDAGRAWFLEAIAKRYAPAPPPPKETPKGVMDRYNITYDMLDALRHAQCEIPGINVISNITLQLLEERELAILEYRIGSCTAYCKRSELLDLVLLEKGREFLEVLEEAIQDQR